MESRESNCWLCKQCTAGVGVWPGFGISTILIHYVLGCISPWQEKLHTAKKWKIWFRIPILIVFSVYLQNAYMNVKPSAEGKMYFYSIPFLHLRRQQSYDSSYSVNFIPKSENMSEGLPSKTSLKKIFSNLWKPQEKPRCKRRFLRIIRIITS